MDVDDVIESIRRQRQAFAYGIEALHTLYNAGREAGDSLRTLPTNTDADPVYTSSLVNARMKMNRQLERATANQLGMQLVVAVGDVVSEVRPNWADDESSVIRSLRLVRNAAAHDNRIVYTSDDPRPNTSWRTVEFTEDLEGTLVFSQASVFMWRSESIEMEEGLFEAGDALALSTDVLEILLDESDSYDVGNVVGLSYDEPPDWAEW